MTDTDTRLNFLGIPVVGDRQMGSTRTEQKTIEDLAPTMQAVIDDPYFTAFGWRQYTPYFNDGDVCEFGVYGFWIKTRDDTTVNVREAVEARYKELGEHINALLAASVITAHEYRELGLDDRAKESAEDSVMVEDDDDDEYKYDMDGTHPSLGRMSGWREDAQYEGTQYEKWKIAQALNLAVQSGAFENVLLDNFGDHAMVTWTRASGNFEIDEYSHD